MYKTNVYNIGLLWAWPWFLFVITLCLRAYCKHPQECAIYRLPVAEIGHILDEVYGRIPQCHRIIQSLIFLSNGGLFQTWSHDLHHLLPTEGDMRDYEGMEIHFSSGVQRAYSISEHSSLLAPPSAATGLLQPSTSACPHFLSPRQEAPINIHHLRRDHGITGQV